MTDFLVFIQEKTGLEQVNQLLLPHQNVNLGTTLRNFRTVTRAPWNTQENKPHIYFINTTTKHIEMYS